MIIRTTAAAVATAFMLATAVPIFVLAAPAPARAQDEVVATVDGAPITETDVEIALDSLGTTLDQVPEGERRGAVIDLLIDMQLIAAAAEREGLDDSDAFARRLAFLRRQALRDVYFAETIENAISEADVRARYDKEVAQIQPRQEVRARHILVEDEEAAKRLIAELKAGASFEELAQEHSKDPGSAAKGGDLGFFGEGQMVPAFEKAAFALYPGEITDEPVQSRFGWHVIKKEETREVAPPAYEDVKDQVRDIVVRERFISALDKLRSDAEIERPTASE